MATKTARYTNGTCGHCHRNLAANAKFCPNCGRAIEPHCGHCGEVAVPGARFCRSCGLALGEEPTAAALPASAWTPADAPAPTPVAPAWRPPASAPVHRSPLPKVAAVVGAIAIAAVVGGSAWFFLRGEKSETPAGPADIQESTVTVTEAVAPDAVDAKLGLPLRPASRLDHPGGASATVPGGAALYGHAMDLRRVDLADDPWWDHGGKGWEFVSFTGVPLEGAATVDLPVASGPAGGVAVVRTLTGMWTELASLPVTLANGQPALRVSIAGVPAPWTLALATPKANAPALSESSRETLRVEALYWTDRAAWEAETVAWLKTNPLASTLPGARYVRQGAPNEPPITTTIATQELNAIMRLFGAARLGVAPDISVLTGTVPIGATTITGQGAWAAGVRRLAVLRDAWVEMRAGVGDIRNLPGDEGLWMGLTDQWLESTMQQYTPWGLDFTLSLIEGNTLQGFDLRVLKPYGELKWTDITIQPGALPAIDSAVADVLAGEQKGPIAGQPLLQRTLRLYGVRSMERLAIIDWFKENVDWVVRWLPVALVAIGAVTGTVIIPGAVGLSLFFAGSDQILNWVQDWYTKGQVSPYAYIAFDGASAGGAGGVSFMMDMWEERALMASEGRAMLPAHGLTIAQFAYSVGMFAAVRGTDWYAFKTIRGVNDGTRGYCDGRCDSITGAIPPVMLHVRATGTLAQEPGSYRGFVDRLMAYRLEYGAADFHTGWLQGHRSGPNGAIADLPFNDYGRDAWPLVVEHTQPDFQVMRLSIPKSAIDPAVWGALPKDASIAEFKPTLFLEGPNGESATIDITKDSARRANESADNFYVTAVLRAKGVEPLAGGNGFGPGYEGAAEQQAELSMGGELLMTLKGTLQFADERTKPMAFALDFGPNPPRPADVSKNGEAAKEKPVPQRVHYIDAALSNDIFGVYVLSKWVMTSGEPTMAKTYNDGRLLPFGKSCETPGACTLGVVRTAYDGERFRAEVCGPAQGMSSTCRGVADSRKFKDVFPDMTATALAPTAHDNFFQLNGPVLTGSDESNAAWNPGEPANIMSWAEIHAEFKDGRVTGTVSLHQAADVLHMNDIRTVVFEIEGTLRKK